ncbi:MAG: hypothetical protein PHQ22_10190 [Sulfuricurvum sp.]|nr:hypothetical protein [Sulfuricurvum sp.]MDD5387549.1 hypothetical protein [Sulfuricurvum sp.]
MNIKKVIIYTLLIAVPSVFLIKWGIENRTYDSNKIPEINPYPKEKLRIYGKFPLDPKKYYIVADAYYSTTNPKCDNVNWIEGARNAPYEVIHNLNAVMSDNHYELNIHNDYYKQGICEWNMEGIYINITERVRKQPSYKMVIFTKKRATFSFIYNLMEVYKSPLDFVCSYRHDISSDYTNYFCKDKVKNILIDNRNALFLPDSQKELEVNFQQMAEPTQKIKQGEK